MHYQHSQAVRLLDGPPPQLQTAEGGHVVIDDYVAEAWRTCAGDPLVLGCLAEARLLVRDTAREPVVAPPASRQSASVTAVVVVTAARELQWLHDCLVSLCAQDPPLRETVVVDNQSGADLQPLCARPGCRVLPLSRRHRLAAALNLAIAATQSEYLLMLNPDVKVAPDTVAHLVARAQDHPRVAAVAPKTLFWRAPAFINGIGNRVGGTNWGSDVGIGQLDLGQFDGLHEIMSASLTIALVSRRALESIGGYDEGFRAYYEDAEWSYRARLLGWKVLAAPAARAFHAFGGYWEPEGRAMSARKLMSAVSGRLRFIVLTNRPYRMKLVLGIYRREDLANVRSALRDRCASEVFAYAAGWVYAGAQLPGMLQALWRRRQRGRRVVGDEDLFDDDRLAPPVLMLGSAPVLTSDVIERVYRPLVDAGRTRHLAAIVGSPR